MMQATNEKLYRRVIGAVLQDIGDGKFKIGSRLPAERELAETNAVSRTTVREAMVALEMLGIVEMRKGSGIYVVSESGPNMGLPDLEIGAFELIEARRMIESEIASLAAHCATPVHIAELEGLLAQMADPDEIKGEEADRAFHIMIAEATGNGALASIVTDLWNMRERAPLARTILHRARGVGLGARIEEHRDVFEAIKKKDGAAARRAMRSHLDRVIEHLLVMTENDDIAAVRRRSASLRERAFLSAVES